MEVGEELLIVSSRPISQSLHRGWTHARACWLDLLRMILAIFLFVFAVLAGAGVFLLELCGIPDGESRSIFYCDESQQAHPAIAGNRGLLALAHAAADPPATIRNQARRNGPLRNVLWPPPIFRFIGARLQLR